MIRIFLVLFIIFTNPLYKTAHAGFLGGLSECITNPCECYCPNVKEVWQTDAGKNAGDAAQLEEKNYDDSGCNCPPYNKFNMSLLPLGGSKSSKRPGCLKGGSKPGLFATYDYNCAEALRDDYLYDYNSHFNPKIKVRSQSCFGVCWFEEKNLKFDGECQYFASSSLIFPVRLCARVAYPSYDGEPADAGYTPGMHLTKSGYTAVDPDVEFTEYIEVNGVEVETIEMKSIVAPKICAYKDPDLFITFLRHGLGGAGVAIGTIVNSIRSGELTAPGIDFLDFNPVKQPLHKTEYGSPLISLLIFIFEQVLNLGEMIQGFMGDLYSDMGMGFMVKVSDFMDSIVAFIGEDVIVNVLKQINSLNRIVDDSYGCVGIPMGPLPPPYCPTIGKNYRPVEMHPICRTGHDGVIEYPTLNSQCQLSSVENKYLRPSIRATFDYYVQECSSGAPFSDACVTFSNVFSADIMHNLYGKLDFIPKCSSSITSGCVNTAFPASTTWTYGGQVYSGYRLVYGYRSIGLINVPLESYIYKENKDEDQKITYSPYDTCSSPTDKDCIFLYGINSGQYADLNMEFPATELTYNNQDLVSTHSFNVGIGAGAKTIDVAAKAIRVSDDSKEQERGEICLYDVSDNNRVVDCQDRLTPPKPFVYSCTSPSASISCTSTHFAPKMIASVESAGLSSQGVVEPATLESEEAVKVNLGGYDYDSFVTDDDFKTIPYDPNVDSHAYSANSRYGEYVGGISLFNNDGSVNNNAIYLRGLEYDFSRYVVGGSKVCLTGYEYERCTPLSNKNCVLTNKVDGYSSLLLEDRIDPPESIGLFLNDSQYFDNTGANFNQDIQAIRNKTSIEMNLCINAPEAPRCPELGTSDAPSNGNATWPESAPAESVSGTCLPGYTSTGLNGPKRACYLNKNTKVSSYQSVEPGTECVSGMPLDPSLKWQRINIAMLNNESLNIEVSGEVSLCRAFVPSNNLQQSSANDASGNLVPIPRISENGVGVGLKMSPKTGNWKSITEIYEGDDVSIIIGPDRVCANSSCLNMNFYNVMQKTNETVNCPTGRTDYHSYCGTISWWDDRVYNSTYWFPGGKSGFYHRMSGGNSIPDVPKIKLDSTDDFIYPTISDRYNYYKLYKAFNVGFSDTYQVRVNDANYDDNRGGYVIYTKQTKCKRSNGAAKNDPGFSDRGRLQIYFASGGEDPNLTNPTTGITDLTVDSAGLTSYSAPADGYAWIKVKNKESDYADSDGMYDLQITKESAPLVCTASGTNPTWPEASPGEVVRGTCNFFGPVLPYRTCQSDANYSPVEYNLSCASADSGGALITSDTDYFGVNSGVITSADSSSWNADLARRNLVSSNMYEYNIYFMSYMGYLNTLWLDNIIFEGSSAIMTLNGTEVFNSNTTNLSGWTKIGSNTFYSNGSANSNLKPYAIDGVNVINIRITDGMLVSGMYSRVQTTINYNYSSPPYGGSDYSVK